MLFDSHLKEQNYQHWIANNKLTEQSATKLEHIDKVMTETCQTTYNLLGWSLGGIIALEIAAILKQKGIQDINVVLLDSVVSDNDLLKLKEKLDIKKLKEIYKNYIKLMEVNAHHSNILAQENLLVTEITKHIASNIPPFTYPLDPFK